MDKVFKHYWRAIIWAAYILLMCSIKLGKVSHLPIFFPGFDKLAHCGFFFVLVVFLCNGYVKRQPAGKILSYKTLIMFTFAAVVYGGAIELLQLYFFTWRSGEWGDLFADFLGASMGVYGTIRNIEALNYVEE